MVKLTLKEQRAIMKALPKSRKIALKKHCQACEMKGEGIMDILKSVGKVLGPIAKEIGPTVLKEIIVPLIKSKVGLGLGLAGGRKGKGLTPAGGGLRLAGQGRKTNPWLVHVKKVRAKNPGMAYSSVLKLASKSWKK